MHFLVINDTMEKIPPKERGWNKIKIWWHVNHTPPLH